MWFWEMCVKRLEMCVAFWEGEEGGVEAVEMRERVVERMKGNSMRCKGDWVSVSILLLIFEMH